jgi:hypothetical protein
MPKDWFAALTKYDDAVTEWLDPHQNVIRTSSPSVDFIFGKGHGLPRGYSVILGGPPKGGKSLISNMCAGWIHQNDPTAFVIKVDAEFRAQVQATPEELAKDFGIDPKRFIVWQTNDPVEIFDRISNDIPAMCKDGLNIAAIIIDSANSIQGMSANEATTLEKQFVADEARTLGRGFKRILKPIRDHKIALLVVCQVRVEMDALEQKRGNKVRMALPFALQHFGEYFVYVEPNRNVEGRVSLDGKEFRDTDATDMDKNSKGEKTAHKIKVTMKDSSCGPKGRVGEFTLGHRTGLVNAWEEVFTLGVNRGIIERPSLSQYKFGAHEWRGKEKVWEDLKKDQALCDEIVAELFARDTRGVFDAEDAKNSADDE